MLMYSAQFTLKVQNKLQSNQLHSEFSVSKLNVAKAAEAEVT